MITLWRSVLIACLAMVVSPCSGQSTGSNGKEAEHDGRGPVRAASSSAAESASRAAETKEFVIGPGDILAINVWREAELSRAVPVRADGRISLPLLGDITAAGRTPQQLQQEIASRLRDYISQPEVAVMVQEIHSQKFNVLGMVMHPGSYPLANPLTVLDAIAVAGGFRDFAKQKSMYLLRLNPDGTQTRFAFNYQEVVKGRRADQNLTLQSNDTIIVP